jgi:hypothetical protein
MFQRCGVSRVGGKMQRQSLHFSVLKVLGRAAIDTRQPADAVGDGTRAISSGVGGL